MEEELKDREDLSGAGESIAVPEASKESVDEAKKEEVRELAEEEEKEVEEKEEVEVEVEVEVDEAAKEGRRLSLYQRVQAMSVPEKIQLALKGDAEARSLLIRDSNKMVATAVLMSPKISPAEVEKIADSTSLPDEILRLVARNREWMRKYQIKVKLVNNPKTPLDVSLKIIDNLREKELRLLSKNRNVPAGLSTKAKSLLHERAKRR
ncbi:MAG: hypothetical protein ABID54_05200 [Pseudomonadota bacterium]